MNHFLKIFLCFFIALVAVSCNNNDNIGPVPLHDYTTQYDTDLEKIEQFLQTRSYTITDHPGFSDDQDVTFTQIPDGDTSMTSVWNSGNLLVHIYHDYSHDIDYKIYYLKLRDGGGAANDKPSPTNVDGVLAGYSGSYLFSAAQDTTAGPTTSVNRIKTHTFESNPFPQAVLSLESAIRGWSEIFPHFKAGDFTSVSGEPNSYSDFGAGVLFIPSALGYYNQSQSAIPAYSPLIFSFKLYEVTRLDQDQDGIPSYLEDLDGDGYIHVIPEGFVNPDDTDGDLAPDYLDLDDDGDLALTKVEIRRPKLNPDDPNEEYTSYSFNGAAIDDPETPNIDETKGVPDCGGDFFTPTRLRKYRDPGCQ